MITVAFVLEVMFAVSVWVFALTGRRWPVKCSRFLCLGSALGGAVIAQECYHGWRAWQAPERALGVITIAALFTALLWLAWWSLPRRKTRTV